MKSYSLLFVFVFMASSMTVKSAELTSFGKISALNNPETENRIILIGFPDQSINRISGTFISSPYRRRGGYQSSTWSQRMTSDIENEYSLHKLTEWPMTEVGIHCAVYQIPEGLSMEEVMNRLKHDQRIKIVQRMHQYRTHAHQYNDPYFKLQSNLHEFEIERVHGIATGRNVTIAIIDTGADTKHPDLTGQIKITKNLASGISASFNSDVHGTAIAGTIVAQKDNKTGIVGVAPNARLIVLKACWPDKVDSFSAACNSFTLALAINTAIKLRADVLNMSLSGPQDPLVQILLEKAVEKGMIIVAADPIEDKLRFPASLADIIPVSEQPSRVTQRRPFSAPGEQILTTLPHGTYDFVSGSSMSAAQVSGVIALLLELKPDLTRSEIYKILQKSTLPVCKTSKNSHTNRINAISAVLEVCDEVACPEM